MQGSDGDDHDDSSTTPGEYGRRRLLKLVGGGAFGLSVARVGYELTGFGTVTGTNVTEQHLGAIARRRLDPSGFEVTRSDLHLAFDGESLHLRTEDDHLTTIPLVDAEPSVAARRGAEYDLGESLRRLAADLDALRAGDVAVEVSGYDAFFDRLRSSQSRTLTVAALRGPGFRRPDPEVLRQFAGCDPSDPRALVTGLAEGFSEQTHFDLSRYVAGNVQDHLLFDAVRLRSHLDEPTTFAAIRDGQTGLYCWEYVLRSLEAFHAFAPHHQSTPVFGAIVRDRRHNHVFTGLASVVREGDVVCIPMTLLDYSHSTMYDNYRLRGVFGRGIDAYDQRHRVSDIRYWNLWGY